MDASPPVVDGRFFAEWFMLAVAMFVGLYTSYTDIRDHRIPNRFTLGLVAFGLAGQLFFFTEGHTTLNQILIQFFGAFILGFALFACGLWAAGDAKLFWASAVALPPTLFAMTAPSSWNYPVWSLAFNALLLSGVFIFFSLLFSHHPDIPRYTGMGPMRLFRRGWELVGLTGVTLGFSLLLLENGLDFVEALLLNLLLYRVFDHFAPLPYRLPLVLPGLGVLAFMSGSAESLGDYFLLWSITWLAESGYVFLRHRYARVLVQWCPISILQEGFTPRESIFRLSTGEGGGMRYLRTFSDTADGESLCKVGHSLTRAQAGTLRNLGRKGAFQEIGDEIIVAKNIPYAPFLLLAVCLTVFSSGNGVLFASRQWGSVVSGGWEILVTFILGLFHSSSTVIDL